MAIDKKYEYKEGHHNLPLRAALHTAYGERCYWKKKICGPLALHDVEIDHIIPQTIDSAHLARAKAGMKLDSDWGMHNPLNLAPICKACNNEKKALDLTEYDDAYFLPKVREAEKKLKTVIRSLDSWYKNLETANGLAQLSSSDMNNPAARKAFLEFAPELVKQLAQLGGEDADFIVFKTWTASLLGDDLEIRAVLDARCRTALTILEQACGSSLEQVAVEALTNHVSDANARIEGQLEDRGMVGPPTVTWMVLDLEQIEFKRLDEGLRFNFAGTYDQSSTWSVEVENADGDGTYTIQADAHITGGVNFSAEWFVPNEHMELEVELGGVTDWYEDPGVSDVDDEWDQGYPFYDGDNETARTER